jgi:hypothetical protein
MSGSTGCGHWSKERWSYAGGNWIKLQGCEKSHSVEFTSRGIMNRMDEATKTILEILTGIQDRMATKDDVQRVETNLESVRRDLQAQIAENTKAIADLAEQLRGVLGYAKEIDLLMTRMSVVEKQLGIAQ